MKAARLLVLGEGEEAKARGRGRVRVRVFSSFLFLFRWGKRSRAHKHTNVHRDPGIRSMITGMRELICVRTLSSGVCVTPGRGCGMPCWCKMLVDKRRIRYVRRRSGEQYW